jgi:chaperone BCS1
MRRVQLPHEKVGSLEIHYLGVGGLSPIQRLLEQAKKEHFERYSNYIKVYYSESNNVIQQYAPEDAWCPPVMRRGKKIDTVCLDEELKKTIVKNLRDFIGYQTAKRFSSSGIPYRRGYLFYGSPGTGKTSLCKALAFLTGLEIFLVNITDIELTDHSLQKLFVSLPPRCIVLLEDVNPTQLRRNNNTETEDVKKKKGVSLSGMVTAIDGPLTCEGPILIMTTNFHKDDFPEELIRPGRIDKAFEFKKATENEALQLFQVIYSHRPKDQLKE